MGLALTSMLLGCGSTGTATPATTPSAGPTRHAAELWGKGSAVKLVNSTDESINVVSSISDTSSGLGDLQPGKAATAEGTFFGPDLRLAASVAGGTAIAFSWSEESLVVGNTICYTIFEVGEKHDYLIENHGFSVERLPDDDWYQFLVTFTQTIAADARAPVSREGNSDV